MITKNNSRTGHMHKAKRAKNDEFFTLYPDIEKAVEDVVSINPQVFFNKSIILPCDSLKSNFVKFFVDKFFEYGLKEVISVSYTPQGAGEAWLIQKTSEGGGLRVDPIPICGDGDFRSEEVQKLIDGVDFVITNPPFSVFRDFFAMLMRKCKSFMVVAPLWGASYSGVFKHLASGDFYIYHKPINRFFDVSNNLISNISFCWFLNFGQRKKFDEIPLITSRESLDRMGINKFLKYDNFDAIEIPKMGLIPGDYSGVMGTSISFLRKYNNGYSQFDILSIINPIITTPEGTKALFLRVLIKRKAENKKPLKPLA